MSLAAWSTPFLTTDQKGSDAWPWVTTTKRYGRSAARYPRRPGAEYEHPRGHRRRNFNVARRETTMSGLPE